MQSMHNLSNISAEFQAIDVNHYGYITRQELQDYVDKHHMDPDTVEKWFTWFDMENSGIITMEEVCTTLGVSMQKQYVEKVQEKRRLSQIPQPVLQQVQHSAPPPIKLAPIPEKKYNLMDGVDILHRGQVQPGVLEESVRLVKNCPRKFEREQDMAKYLKDQLELKYKKHWQVIVASSTIGCMVGHEEDLFMHFRYENYLYIIFRTPDLASL
ncbi:unnamed protein product [Dibothriocephalus latus]|uniref:EF-hand domain-containing protein n=1 Tax=Dibothriocephalus latus TaxID=60516 RepID=A0A3P7LY47_DIBLA|nr:unnamed protein product [Dibothriocephalus latus]